MCDVTHTDATIHAADSNANPAATTDRERTASIPNTTAAASAKTNANVATDRVVKPTLQADRVVKPTLQAAVTAAVAELTDRGTTATEIWDLREQVLLDLADLTAKMRAASDDDDLTDLTREMQAAFDRVSGLTDRLGAAGRKGT